MRVLVIGGTKFIGAHVVRHLAGDGHDLTVYHRGQTNNIGDVDTGSIQGDRNDIDQLRDAIRATQPDVVVDMIAHSQDHARGLIEALDGTDARIVAISSGNIYQGFAVFTGEADGSPSADPLHEDSPLRELPVTGDDKRMVEQTYLGSAIQATAMRLPMVYGPGDPQHRLFDTLRRVLDQRDTVAIEAGLAASSLPRGYVGNVAAAIALAVTDSRSAGRVYNVAEAPIAESQWIEQTLRACESGARVVPVTGEDLPVHLQHGAITEQSVVMDSSRIRTELGYHEVVSRAEALRLTVEWELANPPDPLPDAIDYAAEDRAIRCR